MKTTQPTALLALCDAATNKPKDYYDWKPYSARLVLNARLSPEVVRAVYEALLPVRTIHAPPLQGGSDSDNFERGCSLTKPQIRAMQQALALLDDHNINTEKNP